MEKPSLSGVNPVQAAKELSRVVETVTCIECCKIYILPETAVCGHTLCHGCWIGRPTCPVCASSITRRSLKSNAVVKKYSECTEALVASFEKVFNIKLEEYTQDLPAKAPMAHKDPNLNVKAWLADSQNQFSAPISSQLSTQPSITTVEVKTCDIQIHTNSKKPGSPHKKILAPPLPQDDWDKIETVTDTEDITKNKENVGPIENELFSFEDEEYTTDHPRRSSRKRELKNESKPSENSIDKHTSGNISIDTDKLSKVKQNWSSVKRMRKEFSKLHKKNKNKLNVSIEMCKKTQSAISKATTANVDDAMSQPLTSVTIDDCTPAVNQNEDKKESAPTSELMAIDNLSENDNVNDNQPVNITQNKIEKSHVTNKRKSLVQCDLKDVTNENISKPIDSNKELGHQVSIPFLKKGALRAQNTAEVIKDNTVKTVNHVVNNNLQTPDSDDIQITIKIGNTLTNIFIKKKNNDVKVNLSSDQEVQTVQNIDKSVSSYISTSAPKDCNVQNIEINIGSEALVSAITQPTNCDESSPQNKDNLDKTVSINKNTASAETVTLEPALNKTNNLNKSLSTKKNTESAHATSSGPSTIKLDLDKTVSTKKHTASADTVPFEITDSVEKELSKIMECDDEKNNEEQNKSVKKSQLIPNDVNILPATTASAKQADEEIMGLDDVDIFASGSIKCGKVKMLKENHAPSEILMPSLKPSKKLTQTLRQADKRDRETNDDEIPCNKKLKVTAEVEDKFAEEVPSKHTGVENQSCSMNYDLVMGEVFASIDADIGNVDKSQSIIKNQSISKPDVKKDVGDLTQHSQNLKTQKTQKKILGQSKLANVTQNRLNNLHQKDSENLFTLSNKESQVYLQQKHGPETQAHIENILTPGMCRDLAASGQEQDDAIQATPCQEDDSDMSIYEDTPHKSLPTKSSNEPASASHSSQRHEKTVTNAPKQTQPNSQAARSIIDISDTDNSKTERDVTIVEKPKQTLGMETPSTMNKFCDQVKHNSTPVARKSLNFNQDKQNISTSILSLAKNTQEQEILAKAFESSQKFVKPLPQIRYCIAASCLTSAEVKVVETLCGKKGWLFVREYTNDLTHLVVGVDKDGRSQRTVKFMCAVAAGKWIVRYDWAELCAARGHRAPPEEGPFEALDWTGDPGPRRARLATKKLFEGITFFCKPPFTVLSENVLKTMLEAAGGVVVSEARQVRVVDDAVRLLLAEPEHTQENQYTYLALELSIVPVNYEWALNCLGSYTLSSVADLLLCPHSLLPAAALRWPHYMIAQDAEDDDDDS
ncbi:hypothetical protein MSG28_006115 [Choristoneura fumiferana]|uniref:Uncharacterized protein n=1 Tax=Choristoneura fumiferana TaxID=7141 RepID=A0ACC0JDN0_CHOFU|nr:hypothetical protein MSG28_006115 [Choristoneura fumiferana]